MAEFMFNSENGGYGSVMKKAPKLLTAGALVFVALPALAGSNETLTVGGNRTETIGAAQSTTARMDADIAACKATAKQQTPKTDFGTVVAKSGGANEIVLEDTSGSERARSAHELTHTVQQRSAGTHAVNSLKTCLEEKGYKVEVRGWDAKSKK